MTPGTSAGVSRESTRCRRLVTFPPRPNAGPEVRFTVFALRHEYLLFGEGEEAA
jgi:hypothetical protein